MFARETEPALVADGVVRLGTELVNWYLVEDEGSVVIVDAGAPKYRPQLDRGLTLLGRRTEDVAAVVLTHGHSDHIGFAEPVRAELDVPVLVHRDDERLTTRGKAPSRNEASLIPYLRYGHAWKLLAHLVSSGFPKHLREVKTFEDDAELDVPGRPRTIHTPGHTAGHVSLWLESRRVLVMGDLLCTRNPLTGARGPQLMPTAFNLSNATIFDSLSKVESLEARVLLFGHGDPWTHGTAEALRHARETGPT
jgi:glyoxylase-like metal-dependent hydrolase (beta-lactamase superfamily II)